MRLRRTPTLVAVSLALPLIVTGLVPWWLGLRAETHYRQALGRFTAITNLPITVTRYTRGWNVSEVETEIRVSVNSPPLVLKHRLEHRPQLAEATAVPFVDRLLWMQVHGEIRQSMVPASALAGTPILFDASANLAGRWQIRLSGTAGQIMLGANWISWESLRAHLVGSLDNALQLQIDLPRSTWGTARGAWHTNDLRADVRLHADPNGFPLGSTSITVARLEQTNASGFEELRFSLTTEAQAPDIALTLVGAFQRWHDTGKTLGPGMLAIAVRRLDPEATLGLAQLAPGLLRPEQAGATLTALVPLAYRLGQRSPEAEVSILRLAGAGSELTGQGRLVLDGRRLTNTPRGGALLTALRGELDITIPKSLAYLAPEALRMQTDNHFRLHAVLARGRLLVNGQPWHTLLPPSL